jgi:hypothetical protein
LGANRDAQGSVKTLAAFVGQADRMERFGRILALLALSSTLCACGAATAPGVDIAAAAGLATIPAIGRTPLDAAYSVIAGKDCSMVRLSGGQSYCRHPDPPWDAAPFCTRSLGTVDCWSNPEAFAAPLTPVADGPMRPTAEQEAYRNRHWPDL